MFTRLFHRIAKTRPLHQNNFPTCPTHRFNDRITQLSYESQRPSLTPHQLFLIQSQSLQRPFTGPLWAEQSPGFYHCAVCDTRLFTFNHKYTSNLGYATFWMAVEDRVKVVEGKIKYETQVNQPRPQFRPLNHDHKKCQCKQCGVTIGALFFDGAPPTFLRYTINSALLKYYPMDEFADPNIQKNIKKKAKSNIVKIKMIQ